MASGLLNQTLAANNPTFLAMVQDAIVSTATSIYNEASTLNGNLASGVAVTSIAITPALASTLAAGTVLMLGGPSGEPVTVGVGGAASGSTSIPTTFTPTRNHIIGEPISPPAPSNHGARAAYANKVLANPTGYAVLFAFSCAAQGVDNTSTDAAILAAVSSVWNSVAGS